MITKKHRDELKSFDAPHQPYSQAARVDLLLQELVDSNGGSECVPVLVRGKFKQRDHKITIVSMLTWFSERHHVTGASLGISKIKMIYI